MLKFIRNVVVRSIVISAVVAGVTYGSYWICKGLAWATTQLTALLTTFGEFVKGNTPALVFIIVLVTIANVIFELVSGKASGGFKPTRRRRKASKEADEE